MSMHWSTAGKRNLVMLLNVMVLSHHHQEIHFLYLSMVTTTTLKHLRPHSGQSRWGCNGLDRLGMPGGTLTIRGTYRLQSEDINGVVQSREPR